MKYQKQNQAAAPSKASKRDEKKTIAAIVRVFKASGFNSPRVSSNGVMFVINCGTLLPKKVGTFPLVFTVDKNVVKLKVYFCLDTTTYSLLPTSPLFPKITEFIAFLNSQPVSESWEIDPVQHKVFMSLVLIHTKPGIEFENSIRALSNGAIEAFKPSAEVLYSLISSPDSHVASLLPSPCVRESISFLKPQDCISTNDSESALLLGMKSMPSGLIEANLSAEARLRKDLKPTKLNQYVMWSSVELDSVSESIQFVQPKDCFSLDFYLGHMGCGSAEIYTKIEGLLTDLRTENICVDGLYEQLYVERSESGEEIRVSPLNLAKNIRKGRGGEREVWEKITAKNASLAHSRYSLLSHSEIWAKLDSLWKIDAISISALCESLSGEHTGTIGLKTVDLLDIIPTKTTGQYAADLLARELMSCEARNYGVTAVERPDGELRCYLVRERV